MDYDNYIMLKDVIQNLNTNSTNCIQFYAGDVSVNISKDYLINISQYFNNMVNEFINLTVIRVDIKDEILLQLLNNLLNLKWTEKDNTFLFDNRKYLYLLINLMDEYGIANFYHRLVERIFYWNICHYDPFTRDIHYIEDNKVVTRKLIYKLSEDYVNFGEIMSNESKKMIRNFIRDYSRNPILNSSESKNRLLFKQINESFYKSILEHTKNHTLIEIWRNSSDIL